MDPFRKSVEDFIKKQTKSKTISLEIPPDPEMGDFAFPCFSLSKEMKKAPNKIAEELAEKFKANQFISEVKVVGPYLNFFVDSAKLAEVVMEDIMKKKDKYGTQKAKNERIMVEYSSPNTNKAQHLGHVRNNLLGKSLANILTFIGYDVSKICLMNDKGMGVAKAMVAYKLWGNNKEPNIKPDHFVAHWYVEFSKRAQDDPTLEEQAQEMNRLFEKDDPEVMALWKKMTKWVYNGYDETYERLGCDFDKIYHESKIYKQGKDIIKKGLKEGIFVKDEGAIIADLDEFNLPKKVLIKSDGTSLYMTQDIYLAELKEKDFNMDRSIYVVGSEQQLHFQQLFAILKKLGHDWADKCYHLSYGMIALPEGKMKSREGTVVDADTLMDTMEEMAEIEIKKRHKLDDKEVAKRANQIAMGALKFFILKYEPVKDFLYDPKESLSFEGETGPYIQYVHARIQSILRKHNKALRHDIDYSVLKAKEEKKVLALLKQFPEIVEDAGNHYKPSLLCTYLIALSQAFNEFYHNCPILPACADIMDARLLIADAVRQILKIGLDLLGIEAPDEM